ncbi:MAG TPA: ABC transporter permease [Streptosporangiaceae bacterium]|nr:ABC transporter permease [Streptosporangiaceae bacterium]
MLPPLVFVGVLLLLPVAFIALYSVGLRTNIPGMPTAFSMSNWSDFLTGGGGAFRSRFIYSMEIALLVSVLATIAAYPLAYFLAFVARRRRYALLLVLLAPFFTSYLLRVIAWQIILNNNGVVNSLLWTLHLRPHGSAISWLIYSNFSVALVLFYTWIPFVSLPIFVVLENMDRRLQEAAEDLGASKATTFWRVTLPLSLPGVVAGFVFVLIPTTGEFITPLLVGGPNNQLFGNSIQAFFGDTPNWNYGSVLAIGLIAVVIVLTLVFGRFLQTDLRAEARPTR